jgi:hypothetical protein
MSRQILPHEVAELAARLPAWLPKAVRWSVNLANCAPPWLPDKLGCCPLKACALLVRMHQWGAKP